MQRLFISDSVEVVDVEFPVILGMDLLDRNQLIVYVTSDRLLHKPTRAAQPLKRKYGHVYIELDTDMLYTNDELQKMHRKLFYPTANNLMDLLKRANL